MVWRPRYSSCNLCWTLSREHVPLAYHRRPLTPLQWFGTYNYLDANLPPDHTLLQKLARQAFIGFCASVISDTVSNSLRVVKTYRQVHESDIGYVEAAKAVVAADGLRGLFGRGLKTRIIANGCQGLMFSILWKLFLDL